MYNTRQSNNLHVQSQNSSLFHKSPYMNCVHLFNKLPIYFKMNNDVRDIKAKLFKLLLEKCYYSVQEYLFDNL